MFGKRTRLVTMLAAALGVPYAWFNESLTGTVGWDAGAVAVLEDVIVRLVEDLPVGAGADRAANVALVGRRIDGCPGDVERIGEVAQRADPRSHGGGHHLIVHAGSHSPGDTAKTQDAVAAR